MLVFVRRYLLFPSISLSHLLLQIISQGGTGYRTGTSSSSWLAGSGVNDRLVLYPPGSEHSAHQKSESQISPRGETETGRLTRWVWALLSRFVVIWRFNILNVNEICIRKSSLYHKKGLIGLENLLAPLSCVFLRTVQLCSVNMTLKHSSN